MLLFNELLSEVCVSLLQPAVVMPDTFLYVWFMCKQKRKEKKKSFFFFFSMDQLEFYENESPQTY